VSRAKALSRILITAGPTREKIDSVRFVSNYSTGAMGYEIAAAARKKGYKVTLITGPTELSRTKSVGGVKVVRVEDARQMERAVKKNIKRSDCLFMASAVCDWRPERPIIGKIKKGASKIMLPMVANPDILAAIGGKKNGKLLVGFALESKSLLANARKKLLEKNLDAIVANRVGKKTPFGAGKTDVTIIDKYGDRRRMRNAHKSAIAKELLKKVEELWEKRA